MKLFRYLGWGCFIAAILFAIYQLWALRETPLAILKLQFADAAEGKAMLVYWHDKYTSHYTSLLQEAIKNTWWDFIFIPGYVSVIIILSYHQMQREPAAWLNNLLRLSFFLAIVAGVLDVAENMLLLYNMASYRIGIVYRSTRWLALLKFVLCGWCILVWLISIAGAGKRRRGYGLSKRTNAANAQSSYIVQ